MEGLQFYQGTGSGLTPSRNKKRMEVWYRFGASRLRQTVSAAAANQMQQEPQPRRGKIVSDFHIIFDFLG